jgi:undecaprenyl pyrophosphate phosphatase UppP
MKKLKSIGAVLAGFVLVFVLSTFTDYVLESIGLFPKVPNIQEYTTWMYLLALVYRTIYTVMGGFLTAHLAPKDFKNPMILVWILALIGFVLGLVGTIANWHLAAGAEWYPILLLILSVPAVWLGGYLRLKR